MHTIATKPKTVVVFIPGSWHVPECYDKVIDLLHSKYEISCQKVSLPSNSDNPEATFKDDLDAATSVVTSHLDRGSNVIVVAHSYGGMVGNSVIRGLSDYTESRQNAIIGLVLIASGFAITKWSFMDPFFGRPPPAWRRNASTGFAEIVADPAQLFYHDLDPSEASVGQEIDQAKFQSTL